MARDGIRIEQSPSPAAPAKDEDRRQRSLRSCHLPAEPKPRQAPPRDSGAYVPEMAARIEDDPNLTDGARRCARKLAEYIYRKNRDAPRRRHHRHLADAGARQVRAAPCSATCASLNARVTSRVEVIHARTRMCAGLFVALLAPLFPRHHRQKWPRKANEIRMRHKSHRTIDSE